MYTWDNGVLGTYAQTIGFGISNDSQYSANDSYANNRWENSYKVLAQWRTLQKTYDEESEAKQKEDKAFLDMAEVYLYDQLSQIVDLWGDVPFTEAGYLGITGDVEASYPGYDAATLYNTMLTRLGEIANELASIASNTPATTAAALPRQDILCGGDLNKWVKYTNALRLRLALRVSLQGSLASTGQSVAKEVVGKALPTGLDDSVWLVGDNGSTDQLNFKDAIRDGYKDHARASQPMLDVLLKSTADGTTDPRLPIMYTKNYKGEYLGLSSKDDEGEQSLLAQEETSINHRVWSRLDSCTVQDNQYFMHPVMTAAEVDFGKAEVYQRGWVNGNAKAAFISGVVNATKYMYQMHSQSLSGYSSANYKTVPTDAEVEAYAEKVWENAADKLEVILTQKWFNFGWMQTTQAWAELRRTGLPNLYYRPDPTAQLIKEQPNRIRYPASERNTNAKKYNEQVSKMPKGDDYTTKIFWAK